MKRLAAIAIPLALLAAADAAAQSIEISSNGSRPSSNGAAQNFTGSVMIDPLFSANAHTRANAGQVTFQPGARTAWHSHPAGQTLIVTSGTGWVQEWDGPRREIRPGDVIWTPPGVKHWHGGTTSNGMSHVAIHEAVNGEVVRWMEHVSDAQYTSQGTSHTTTGDTTVSNDSTPARGPYADIAPALDQYTQQVLFGDLWERPGLSKRDRSLITVATLVANYRTNELPFHLNRALENGVTQNELVETITHLAFYAGWPTANTAVGIARQVFADAPR